MKNLSLTATITKTEAQDLAVQALRVNHHLPDTATIAVVIEDTPVFTTNRAVLDRPAPDSVRDLMVNHPHDTIAAIKELRTCWGCGLKEAKDYVELYRYVFLGGVKPF